MSPPPCLRDSSAERVAASEIACVGVLARPFFFDVRPSAGSRMLSAHLSSSPDDVLGDTVQGHLGQSVPASPRGVCAARSWKVSCVVRPGADLCIARARGGAATASHPAPRSGGGEASSRLGSRGAVLAETAAWHVAAGGDIDEGVGGVRWRLGLRESSASPLSCSDCLQSLPQR